MKTVRARVRNGGIRLPKKLGVKEGAQVRVLIPDGARKSPDHRSRKMAGISPAGRKLLDRIDARRRRIGPVGFSLTQAIREDRDRGR